MTAPSIPIWDYRGQRYVGRVAEIKPSLFEAVTGKGKTLGVYNSASAAAGALILEAAHPWERAAS